MMDGRGHLRFWLHPSGISYCHLSAKNVYIKVRLIRPHEMCLRFTSPPKELLKYPSYNLTVFNSIGRHQDLDPSVLPWQITWRNTNIHVGFATCDLLLSPLFCKRWWFLLMGRLFSVKQNKTAQTERKRRISGSKYTTTRFQAIRT